MRIKRPFAEFAVVLGLLFSGPALASPKAAGAGPFAAIENAQTLRSQLQIFQDAVVSASGRPVVRWREPISIYLEGQWTLAQRTLAHQAINQLIRITGLPISLTKVSSDSNLVISMSRPMTKQVKEQNSLEALSLYNPCETIFQEVRQNALVKVQIRMLPEFAHLCLHHELMHAMGVRGHPQDLQKGQTVLDHQPQSILDFLAIDRILLGTLYSPEFPMNGTRLEWLLEASALWIMMQSDDNRAVAQVERDKWVQQLLN